MSEPKELLMPPDLLIKEWQRQWETLTSEKQTWERFMIAKAAQWGADKELGACYVWLKDVVCDDPQDTARALLAHRRPKPPSLKEQALEALKTADIGYSLILNKAEGSIVRLALEALPDE
jgi:hypothetical protein